MKLDDREAEGKRTNAFYEGDKIYRGSMTTSAAVSFYNACNRSIKRVTGEHDSPPFNTSSNLHGLTCHKLSNVKKSQRCNVPFIARVCHSRYFN